MAAVDQKTGIFSLKKLASLTGDTRESLQFNRWHQNAPEGAFPPFKVLILVYDKMYDIMSLYIVTYGGN